MNLNAIPTKKDTFNVNAFIEIPKNSNIKYEYNHESGLLIVSRMLHSAMYYPTNYGFIPNTLAQDNEPVDVLILNDQALLAGSVITCRIIGLLEMEDEGGIDEKLLALPISDIDPTFDEIEDIEDISKAFLQKIKNFFETYKMLEPNKWVKVKGFQNKQIAFNFLQESIERYLNK